MNPTTSQKSMLRYQRAAAKLSNNNLPSNEEPEFAVKCLDKERHASLEEPNNRGHTFDQQSSF